MPQHDPLSTSGSIALTITSQPDGRTVCRVTPSLDGLAGETRDFYGQNVKHAIAIALENLAYVLRTEADAEQKIDPEAVEWSPSGSVVEKRFHVIAHYEDVIEDESKFEATVSTLLGNTVVEGAQVSVIQIDPDLPVEPLAPDLDVDD